MTVWYVDPDWPTAGSGSVINPYANESSAVLADGDTISVKCGTEARRQFANALAANNLTVNSYDMGAGTKPIFNGADTVSAGAFVATAQAGIYAYTLPGNTGGNVTENGTYMLHKVWTTNLATTAPTIPLGGFSIDTATSTVYIRPASGGAPTGTYEVSARLQNFSVSGGPYVGLLITGLELKDASRYGVIAFDRSDFTFRDNVVRHAGGHATTTTYVGQGIEFNKGCHNHLCEENDFYDIFDSPITPQVSVNSHTINGGVIRYNRIYGCGFFAIEISITNTPTNAAITNIKVYCNTAYNVGFASWRDSTVTARGISVSASQATSTLGNIQVFSNVFIDCRWGLSANTRDCVSYGILFSRNVCLMRNYTSPSNGRGIYTNGNAKFVGNKIVGYTYGIGVYGTSVVTRTPTLINNSFIDCPNGIVSDVSGAGTTTLRLRNNLFKISTQLFQQFGSGLLFDMDWLAITAGITVNGLTIGSNTIRPTNDAIAMNDETYDIGLDSVLVAACPRIDAARDVNGRPFYGRASIGCTEPLRARTARALVA